MKNLFEFENRGNSLYQELKSIGAEIENYESGLYVKLTPEVKKIIERYKKEGNIRPSIFKSGGELWYDIPFSFDPREKKIKKESLNESYNPDKKLKFINKFYYSKDNRENVPSPEKNRWGKSALSWLKNVWKGLEEKGWTKEALYWNKGGPAIKGDVVGLFWKTPKIGLYISIGEQPFSRKNAYDILYRATTPEKKWEGFENNYLPEEQATAENMIKAGEKVVAKYEKKLSNENVTYGSERNFFKFINELETNLRPQQQSTIPQGTIQAQPPQQARANAQALAMALKSDPTTRKAFEQRKTNPAEWQKKLATNPYLAKFTGDYFETELKPQQVMGTTGTQPNAGRSAVAVANSDKPFESLMGLIKRFENEHDKKNPEKMKMILGMVGKIKGLFSHKHPISAHKGAFKSLTSLLKRFEKEQDPETMKHITAMINHLKGAFTQDKNVKEWYSHLDSLKNLNEKEEFLKQTAFEIGKNKDEAFGIFTKRSENAPWERNIMTYDKKELADKLKELKKTGGFFDIKVFKITDKQVKDNATAIKKEKELPKEISTGKALKESINENAEKPAPERTISGGEPFASSAKGINVTRTGDRQGRKLNDPSYDTNPPTFNSPMSAEKLKKYKGMISKLRSQIKAHKIVKEMLGDLSSSNFDDDYKSKVLNLFEGVAKIYNKLEAPNPRVFGEEVVSKNDEICRIISLYNLSENNNEKELILNKLNIWVTLLEEIVEKE